jgi:sigma-B regulation protein RsbU (phosphoserine phosphatase)
MPSKRPTLLYGLLALIFVITLAYHVFYFPDLFRREAFHYPFFAVDPGTNEVAYAGQDAISLRIHNKDHLLAVNGQPFTGTGMLARAMNDLKVGRPIVVTVGDRTISLPVTADRPAFWESASGWVIEYLLPVTSLLLGFWVAFRRPSDPMAWLLLALMMSFPQILRSFIVEGWSPGFREAGLLYETSLEAAFPIVIYLFGRYFPEPFPKGSRYEKIWNVIFWVFGVPFLVAALCGIVISLVALSNYRAVASFDHAFKPLNVYAQISAFVMIGSFFSATGIKLGESKSIDARRRLKFLYWGAIAAFTPALLPTIGARLLGKTPNEILPAWLLAVLAVPLILFPLTLAYVIVVQKAMGVGLALRQGLQYAVARGGIRALQMTAMGVVIVAGLRLAVNARQDRLQKTIIIVAGITAYFTIRRVGDRLRTWVDRRFFREAYNTEGILTELSEQVRSMVEPRPLLETVAARISETLHVPQVAVLLDGAGVYRPALALGYGHDPGVSFGSQSATAMMLKTQKEPAHVFLNDRDSWVYREEGVTEEERGKLATLRSELLLPLAVRDKLLGFISLGAKRSEEPYTGSDVRLLKSVAAQTGLALENAKLMQTIAEEVAQRERLNREVEIAREVQERLFPQTLPPVAGLDYAGHCRPALGVGGDYYDFLALPNGRLGIAIGDVSGKGIAAALMMASLQASLRGEATRAPDTLATALSNVNHLVYEASSANRYATFFYGQYDPASGRFDYVNAGHNPPILLQQGKVVRLEEGGMVIGLLDCSQYQQGSVTIRSGDWLVAFTDGISEAMNEEDEEWGEERLIEAVCAYRGKSANELLVHLFDQATTFAGTAPQHDDMTMVVVRAF